MSEAVEVEEIPAGFRQTQLGPRTITLPEHWSRVRIEDVSEVVTRGKQPTYVDEPGIPVLNQSCIYWDGYHQENLKYLDEDVAKDWKPKHFATKGDILINSTGQGTLGRALYWDKESGTHAIDSHITRVSVDSDTIDPEFLRYYLESTWGQTMLYVFCVAGSTGQIELSKTDLMSMPLLCPPVEEQRRIADILSTVDEQIQQTDQIIEENKSLKKGLLQNLFGELSLRNNRKDIQLGPFEVHIPDNWEISNLDELNEDSHPICYGVVQPGDHYEDGVPLLNIEDIDETGEIQHESIHKISRDLHEQYSRSRLQGGEVLVSVKGTVGNVVQLDDKIREANISRDLARITPTSELDARWLKYCLSTKIYRDLIDVFTTGSTRASLNIGELREIPIIRPPVSEQERISEVLTTVDRQIELEHETKIDLQELKRGLMQDLLTGKVRVTTD